MDRCLHGGDECFPWDAHMSVLKLLGHEVYWSTHAMHLETPVVVFVHGK